MPVNRVALEHLAPFKVASQNFCQAGGRTAVQPMLKGPLTQIALDQQDAFAAELCRATQRQGQQGFAFGRAGGGDGDDLGVVDVQRHAGSKRSDLFRKGGQRPANDKVVDFQMSQLALAQLGDQGKAWHAGQTPDFLTTKQRCVG